MRLDNMLVKWLDQTQTLVTRSVELKAVDEAVKTFLEGAKNRKNTLAIQSTLAEWKDFSAEVKPASIEYIKGVIQKVNDMVGRLPHQLTVNMPKLEDDEWFMVNLKKRSIADKSGKTFDEFKQDDFNCFTYAQGHTLWSLEMFDPITLTQCDDTYKRLGFTRIYPEKDTKISIGMIPLSYTHHAHLLAHTGVKIVVYGRKESWPEFYAQHHVLRTPKGYESKSGYLECIFHKTLAQLDCYMNGQPFLLYYK